MKIVFSRMKTNLNLPQSRRFRPFRQMLARCIHIHLRSPLLKIIKNGGFEVASEFNGKKTIKTRQSSEVVLECTTSENNTVFSGISAVKSSSSLFPFGYPFFEKVGDFYAVMFYKVIFYPRRDLRPLPRYLSCARQARESGDRQPENDNLFRVFRYNPK